MTAAPLKILQIVYYYPPMGGAGVQRGLKFSRYLPLHGVTPVVLAAHDPHYVRDMSLLAEVPAGLEVHRVAHSPWLARLAARRRAGGASTASTASAASAASPVASPLAPSVTPPVAPSVAPSLAPSIAPSIAPSAARSASWSAATTAAPSAPPERWAPVAAAGAAPGWHERLRHMLRDAALRTWRATQWPDDMAMWARQALIQARRIIAAHAASGQPIQLVFSSAPPASAHWLGERIAREAGLPWVADFRDLWTDNPAYDMPGWRRALDRRLEDRWLQRATGVVTVTPSWRDMLAARRPAGAPTAFIPNGYDDSDFAALAPPPPRAPGTFTLVHTGTFYGPRDPAGLLDGLTRYLSGDTADLPSLRVRLVGNMGARFSDALRAFDQRHPGIVQVRPYLPHAQALGELMAADALLLVVGGGHGPAVSGWLPGKIFEYLRSGKPVLTLGDPAGDAATMINRYAQAWVRQGDDAEGIAQALAQMARWAAARSTSAAGANWATASSAALPVAPPVAPPAAPPAAPLAAPLAALPDALPDAPPAASPAALPAASPAASPAIFERRELSRQLADFLRHCAARHNQAHG